MHISQNMEETHSAAHSDLKFTRVLRTTRSSARYVVDYICNDEIVCMRGYSIHSSFYWDIGIWQVEVYNILPGICEKPSREYVRRMLNYRNTLLPSPGCIKILTVRVKDGKLVDINYSYIVDFYLKKYVDSTALNWLKRCDANYDINKELSSDGEN